MEEKYEVTFETKLTNELIDGLIQHQTLSSLRRAVALSPCIMKADDVENMPTIYYAYNRETGDWEHHALTSDLITYLLKGQAEEGGSDDEGGEDTPTEPTHDGTIEIVSPAALAELEDVDGRIDISNDYVDTVEEAFNLEVKITMDDTEGTFTGEYFIGENTEGAAMDTAVANVITATIEIPANTEKGTPINFKVTDGEGKVDTFVIAYGSAEQP